jgi:hypothetical protein
VKQILVLAVLLVGCAAGRKSPTIRGVDLYAHANQIREHGSSRVPTSQAPVVVRSDQYLVDSSREQVFYVGDIVAGCHGRSLSVDTECTVALMQHQTFFVTDEAPQPRATEQEPSDISGMTKARIVLAAATTALIVGAAKCDAFDGCGTLLGIGAAVPGALLLLSMGSH